MRGRREGRSRVSRGMRSGCGQSNGELGADAGIVSIVTPPPPHGLLLPSSYIRTKHLHSCIHKALYAWLVSIVSCLF